MSRKYPIKLNRDTGKYIIDGEADRRYDYIYGT
jgi:hypothetical protein